MATARATPRPSSPPLQSWSTLAAASSSDSPASAHHSPFTPSSSSLSTPASSLFSTPHTAFTTPGSAKSLSPQEAVAFELVGKPASAPPPGFAHLDTDFNKETGSSARSFEWEAYVQPADEAAASGTSTPRVRYKRRLGPTEASYYLGSRGVGLEGGVNDMYLHLGYKARASLMAPARVLDAWTEVVNRHALLASSVEFNDYYDVRFSYDAPTSSQDARRKAASLLSLVSGKQGKDLLSEYLNGPRFLSNDRLAYLVISTPEPTFSPADAAELDPEAEQEYDLLLLSTHFLGDGMALHTTANELFTLLAAVPSAEGVVSKNIEAVLAGRGEEPTSAAAGDEAELLARAEKLAPAMESKLVTPEKWGRLGWAAAKVEFENEQAKLVGGHAFPRARLGPRHTLVPTVSWPEKETKAILAACKRHGVTIAHAMFALSNGAYVRTVDDARRKPELPVMLYSALNIRPFLRKEDPPADWYHIAIGYYNIILPSFIPRTLSPSAYFWHQCASVKAQTSRAVKTPFLAPRTALMALERERRSVGFERADDEKRARVAAEGLAGLGISGMDAAKAEKAEAQQVMPSAAKEEKEREQQDKHVRPKAPSTALLGLSMLGNLDGMYRHADFHGIQLHTLTTGSRQRPGAALLFAYTFAGKLWVSLGYDSNGFVPGVIERWRTALIAGVEQFLLLDEA
ncbi:hypothetical protein JCM10449v2_000435 [Rhodotorula kratochvilovae]